MSPKSTSPPPAINNEQTLTADFYEQHSLQTTSRPKRSSATKKFSHPKYHAYSLKSTEFKSRKQDKVLDSKRETGCVENLLNIKKGDSSFEGQPVEESANKPKVDALHEQIKDSATVETSPAHYDVTDHDNDSAETEDTISQNSKSVSSIIKKIRTTKPLIDRSKMKRPHYRREYNVSCFVCPAKLKDYDSMHTHFILKHADHPDFDTHVAEIRSLMRAQCHQCGKIFARKEMLNQHVKVLHQEQIQVTCPHCHMTIRSEKHLKDHIRRIHTYTEKKHLCHLCPASFRLPEYLSCHIKNVHSEGPAVSCSLCGKQFSSLKFVRNHKSRVHGERKHDCLYCGKKFMTGPNMRRHIQLIHEQPNERSFSCNYCSRKFTLKCNLKEHEQTIHLKQFPHRCDICNLGFRRKTGLKVHQERDCPGAIINMLQGSDNTQPILFLPQGEGGQEPLTVESVEELQKLLAEYMPAQNTPKNLAPKPLVTTVAASQLDAMLPMNSVLTEEGQKTVSGIKYIVATPEMMKEFGLDFPVVSQTENVIPEDIEFQ